VRHSTLLRLRRVDATRMRNGQFTGGSRIGIRKSSLDRAVAHGQIKCQSNQQDQKHADFTRGASMCTLLDRSMDGLEARLRHRRNAVRSVRIWLACNPHERYAKRRSKASCTCCRDETWRLMPPWHSGQEAPALLSLPVREMSSVAISISRSNCNELHTCGELLPGRHQGLDYEWSCCQAALLAARLRCDGQLRLCLCAA
jgi:hypothetical protein